MPVSQYPFQFGHVPALSAADFLPAASNEAALGWVRRWPDWPRLGMALWGPEGSGKSHLAAILAERAGGIVVAAERLAETRVPDLASQPLVALDDADRADETALFHLHNLLAEAGGSLLLTAREAPARWTIALPDLRSRLSALPAIGLQAPDDELLRAVLVKLFADRRLTPDPDALSAILVRMERSFAAARRIVAELDAASMARRGPVTAALVRAILSERPAEPG